MENDLKMDTRKNPENLYAVRMMIVRLSKRGLYSDFIDFAREFTGGPKRGKVKKCKR